MEVMEVSEGTNLVSRQLTEREVGAVRCRVSVCVSLFTSIIIIIYHQNYNIMYCNSIIITHILLIQMHDTQWLMCYGIL